jgi:[ribosomal protein S5]-alanine N-acetyltransferase
MTVYGYPAVLSEKDVLLRPYRRDDAVAWSTVRLFNERWLRPWEVTPPASWAESNSVAAYRMVHRSFKHAVRTGESMPFVICYQGKLVGHIGLGNIVRRAFSSAYAGYWIDSRVAGHGIMPTALALLTDHAFYAGRLHRVEVNIRPENKASRRVVEKLGFREEGYHPHYMYIDGAWRDHVGYAMTWEDIARDGGVLARWRRARAS